MGSATSILPFKMFISDSMNEYIDEDISGALHSFLQDGKARNAFNSYVRKGSWKEGIGKHKALRKLSQTVYAKFISPTATQHSDDGTVTNSEENVPVDNILFFAAIFPLFLESKEFSELAGIKNESDDEIEMIAEEESPNEYIEDDYSIYDTNSEEYLNEKSSDTEELLTPMPQIETDMNVVMSFMSKRPNETFQNYLTESPPLQTVVEEPAVLDAYEGSILNFLLRLCPFKPHRINSLVIQRKRQNYRKNVSRRTCHSGCVTSSPIVRTTKMPSPSQPHGSIAQAFLLFTLTNPSNASPATPELTLWVIIVGYCNASTLSRMRC